MPYLYKLVGKKAVPCNVMEWAADFKKDRTVAKTKLGDILISTVFLGVDHAFSDNNHPILFETMVFDADQEGCERYSTWEEAEAGHLAMVEKIKAKENVLPPKLLNRFEILKMPG